MGVNPTWRNFGWNADGIPAEPLEDDVRRANSLPRTLIPVLGEGVVQRPVFEPALKQYRNAYRATDPRFPDPARTAAWQDARRRALSLVLEAVAASEWAESLVLRGSVLMALWFGEQARVPGDLDFVVVPDTWGLKDGRTGRMLESVAAWADETAREHGEDVGLSAAGAFVEDIWTYDRVPGLRMMLPWSAPGLPGGQVQLDFVFQERLPEPPDLTELPGGGLLQTASPRLSLAWKLLWLVTDMHPQGKDLYDAALLAERYGLSYALLDAAGRCSDEVQYAYRGFVTLEDLQEALRHVEWEHLVTEYPDLGGDQEECAGRLVRALAPHFPDDRRSRS